MKRNTRIVAGGVVAALACGAVAASVGVGSASAAVGFNTPTAWSWQFKDLAADPAPSLNQYAQATVSGLTDQDKNAAFVLRKNSTGWLIVNLSGTRYQIWSVKSGQWTDVLNIARPAGASGTARVEVNGTNVKTTLNGTVIDSRSLAIVATHSGTGQGVAIWQNVGSAVNMTNIVNGPLGATTAPSPAPTVNGTYDANGVMMSAPTALTDGSGSTVTGSVKVNSGKTFQYLQIAVRDAAGNWKDSAGASFDTAYSPGTVLAAGASKTLTGKRVFTNGTYTASIVYSLDGSKWFAGPTAKFTVGGAGTTTPTPQPSTTTPTPQPSTTVPTPPPVAPTSSAFVKRSGTSLYLNGKKWQYVGYNAVHMLGCTTSDRAVNDIEGFFSGVGRGMTHRVWVLPNSDLGKVDRVVAAAKANGAHVFFVLADANGACGDPGGQKNSSWYNGGWRSTHEAWIRTVVSRYKNEPTVAFWETVNESGGDGNAVGNYNQAVGSLIKSLDPNHLVESGTMPSYAFGGAAGWKAANAAPAIDITDIHEYDENQVAAWWLTNDLQYAKELGKPVIVGEFGIEASQTGSGTRPLHGGACAFNFTTRAARAKAKLDAYIAIPEVAGVTYWAYSGKSRTGSDCDIEFGPNDTQIASVFAAKAATLR